MLYNNIILVLKNHLLSLDIIIIISVHSMEKRNKDVLYNYVPGSLQVRALGSWSHTPPLVH